MVFLFFCKYMSSYFAVLLLLQCYKKLRNGLVPHLWSLPRAYGAAGKSLTRPTPRYILFDVENISFDASLVMCINSNNIPQIMIINRIYETQNLLSL